jgi:hypothetical protein
MYEHWDQLRHLTPPEGMTSENWWLGIKMARHALRQDVPLADKAGRLSASYSATASRESCFSLAETPQALCEVRSRRSPR